MIKSPNFWKQTNVLSLGLLPISFIYLCVLKLYQLFSKETFIGVPIICIGNIVVGGSGKTPMVIKLRKLLNNYNKIFVLTRGYKGSKKGPLIVSKNSTYQEVGDESIIHAKYGSTCVSKNKRLGAFLCRKERADLIIMDDGLQSKDLEKKIKILVIDSDYGFGNNLLLPAGPLRDTIGHTISECDFIIVFGNPKDDKFKKITGKKNLFFAQKIITIKRLRKKKIYAFSGLGNNENFLSQLKKSKYEIIKFKTFPDHYNYSEDDLKNIINEAEKYNLPIVCTEKDYVKVPKQFKKKIYVAELDIKIFSLKNFVNSVKQKLVKS